MDMEAASIPFKINAVAILRLCNTPVLPFEFVTVAETFKNVLSDLQKSGKAVLDMTSLLNQVATFKKGAVALKKGIEKNLLALEKKGMDRKLKSKFKEINSCLMKLSRMLMPVLSSKAGKYGQDPFGSRLGLLPTLQPLKRLSLLDADSEECRALLTSLLRERNKLSDALNSASCILDNTLKGI